MIPSRLALVSFALVVGCSSDPGTEMGQDDAASLDDSATAIDGAIDAAHSDAGDGGGTTLSPRWVGRFTPVSGAKRAAWSGAFVEARFVGTKITLRLEDSGAHRFAITLAGTESRITPTANVDAYVLGDNLAPGEHVVRVLKDTEASVGQTDMIGLELDTGGQFLPIAVPSRRIEVIGDSISCGYGDLGLGPNCNFSADTESFRESYGSVLGKKFGADVMGICWSGIGVYRNYGGSTVDVMPTRYPRTLPSSTTSTWNFSSVVPDVVLWNLGTNDFTGSSPPEQPFESAYEAFLATIRKHYPNAFILSILGGPMLTGTNSQNERTWVKNVIAKLTTAGDTEIDSVELPPQTGSHGGIGCDYHPSVGEHAFMATTIAPKLSAALGW
ncbi:SGNH/GDSL hydrolase family protein [soil metagenome]